MYIQYHLIYKPLHVSAPKLGLGIQVDSRIDRDWEANMAGTGSENRGGIRVVSDTFILGSRIGNSSLMYRDWI